MALEGHEPLWTMGDDTPLAGLAPADRPVVDHLRQSFAQVTNPPIDPERERIGRWTCAVELGRRSPLLGGRPRGRDGPPERARRRRSRRAASRASRGAAAGPRPSSRLDATWDPSGRAGRTRGGDRPLAPRRSTAATRGIELVVLTDRAASAGEPAAGAVGARGRRASTRRSPRPGCAARPTSSSTPRTSSTSTPPRWPSRRVPARSCPWLAIELAAELAGSRGAEDVAPDAARNLMRRSRPACARCSRGWASARLRPTSAASCSRSSSCRRASSRRCFPAAPAWPGRLGSRDLAEPAAASARGGTPHAAALRPDGSRTRALHATAADGELHLYAPPIVKAVQALATADVGTAPEQTRSMRRSPVSRGARARRRRRCATSWRLTRRAAATRRRSPMVEPARDIAARFVGRAMCLGALSPEAHQALDHRHAPPRRRREHRRGRRGSGVVRARTAHGRPA